MIHHHQPNRRFIKKRIVLFLVGIFLIGLAIPLVISYRITSKFTGPIAQGQEKSLLLHTAIPSLPVTFTTTDGTTLSAILFIRPKAQRTVLVAHGHAENKQGRESVVTLFNTDNVLLFDFRAHGTSEGTLTSVGYHEYKDIAAARAFLAQHPATNATSIVGIGFSMGAATLLHAAAKGVPFDALIIDSSFDRLDKQITRVFRKKTELPRIPFMWGCWFWYRIKEGIWMSAVNPVEWAKETNVPKLFIHSLDDSFTPASCSQELFDASAGYKELWLEKGAIHAALVTAKPQEYKKRVEQFLANALIH